MKLVKADVNEVYRRRSYVPGKIQAIIAEFMQSGMDAAKVETAKGEYKDAYCCTSTFKGAIKTMHLADSVAVITNNKTTYLVRKDRT